jgi:membrane-bound serine protease (ClpP class)
MNIQDPPAAAFKALFTVAFTVALTVAGVAFAASARAQERGVVRSLRIEGPITAVTADYLARVLAMAEREEATALLLELDTPGGDDNSMQAMAGSLLNAPLPTIVWVGPEGARAASAGTFLVLAAHVAGMAPRTTIGAASPVGGGGEDLPETLGRKATEDLAAAARSYAARRGDDAADWAERAVRDAVSASAEEALALGIVDAVAPDAEALLEAVTGTEVMVQGEPVVLGPPGSVSREPMTQAEAILAMLVNPAVALLLITLGVNAILIELSNPGGFVAGIVGVLALAVGLYSLGVLEANLVGLVFIAAAFVLFVLEVKSAGHGLLAAAGLALFVVGAAVLFAGGPFAVPKGTIAAIALGTAAFLVIVLGGAVRVMRRRPVTGGEALIGAFAEVRRALMPDGRVMVYGELWDATSATGEPLARGRRVRILERRGFRLLVEAAEHEPGGTASDGGPEPVRRSSEPDVHPTR